MSARKWAGMRLEIVLKVVCVHVWVHLESILGSILGSIIDAFDGSITDPPGSWTGWTVSCEPPTTLPPLHSPLYKK